MESIVNALNSIVGALDSFVWNFPESFPWVAAVLLAVGAYVTIRLVFIQVRHVKHAVHVVTGRFDDPDDPGDVNHFQALSTALSATVGIGNIAGVAMAMHYGGPGALFWMWVTAILGMALKFAECTLSVHYRSFDAKGEVAGGPMYYIERGLGPAWKPLAVIFAVFAICSSFGTGNMAQANTVALSASNDLGVEPWIIGLLLAAVVGIVILGGIRSIASVTSKLTPIMGVIYVLAAAVIMVIHADQIPGALRTIVVGAFSPEASLGGSVAGVWIQTLLWGVKRGLYSNEAGQGSAPIAHAAAKTNEPVREGAVAMLEPLIDTLIICTMTGLVIVITGVWDAKKPNKLSLGTVSVALSDAERGAEGTTPDPIEVLVREGAQSQLVFRATSSTVDEARIVNGSDGAPFTGTLLYSPAAGSITALAADGGEMSDLMIEGLTLYNSSALTSWAFQVGLSPLGDWGNWVVTLCVFLFAISTMISWSYYGDRCVTYLFGARYVIVYRCLYIGFVYFGATKSLELIWTLGDITLGLMTVPNLLAVFLLTPKIMELSRDYFARMKERG